MSKTITAEQRFWSKADQSAGANQCWPWSGCRNEHGYGTVKHNGRPALAHRVAYELACGPIPQGQVILHICDNPACVNPAHLKAGSQGENVKDCEQKGRTLRGERNPRAHLTAAQVKRIRSEYGDGHGPTLQDLAKLYHVGHVTIWNAIHRVNWSCVP